MRSMVVAVVLTLVSTFCVKTTVNAADHGFTMVDAAVGSYAKTNSWVIARTTGEEIRIWGNISPDKYLFRLYMNVNDPESFYRDYEASRVAGRITAVAIVLYPIGIPSEEVIGSFNVVLAFAYYLGRDGGQFTGYNALVFKNVDEHLVPNQRGNRMVAMLRQSNHTASCLLWDPPGSGFFVPLSGIAGTQSPSTGMSRFLPQQTLMVDTGEADISDVLIIE